MTSSVEQTLPRSAGAIPHRRKQLHWPDNRNFRILSLDGGGIRGIYSAAFLAGLENNFLGGQSITNYFDLIAGTSTGGIIALGLGAGLSSTHLYDLYHRRGSEIFPPRNPFARKIAEAFHLFTSRYDRTALENILNESFGERTLGESRIRLCIPSCDGEYGEVYIFKTPHHPDYKRDKAEKMTKVGLATSAAPSYYKPLEDGGYTFLDGGIWCNNPIMVALVDTLACYDVPRNRIDVLSIGCGDSPYQVNAWQKYSGGILSWLRIISAAMRFQSQNALGQAGLLVGANHVIRICPIPYDKPIALDDWKRASVELPSVADKCLEERGDSIASTFFKKPSVPYTPGNFTPANPPIHQRRPPQ